MAKLLLALFAFALWLPSTPSSAQPDNRNSVSDAVQRAERRAEVAEQAALTRELADRLEDAQTAQAYNRFEIWMGGLVGFFSVGIAILVLVFGTRTERAAAAAAAAAAQQQIVEAKAAIESISNDAKAASDRAKEAATEASTLVAEAKQEVDRLFEQARSAAASVESSARQATEEVEKVKRGAEALAQVAARAQSEIAELRKPDVVLTPDETAAVKAGVEATPEKSDNTLTVNEFKVQIGKAAYIENDHNEAFRLASLMESVHADNEPALSFALLQQGDALRKLGRGERAIGVYADLISRFSQHSDREIQSNVLRARFNRGLVLEELSRHKEAEEEYRELIPLQEKHYGLGDPNAVSARHQLGGLFLDQDRPVEAEKEIRASLKLLENTLESEDSNSLTMRHNLALALADQGLASEAEAEFRAILPLKERIDGPNHKHTLSTRQCLAAAMLDNGHAAEAEAELRGVLPRIQRVFGIEAEATLIARYTLARAILAQGRAAEAVSELREILEIEERLGGNALSSSFVTRYLLADATLQAGDIEGAEQLLAPIPQEPMDNRWLRRWSAELAFIRARVADARGRGHEASKWLAEAQSLYAAIYPSHHIARERLSSYIAKRVDA